MTLPCVPSGAPHRQHCLCHNVSFCLSLEGAVASCCPCQFLSVSHDARSPVKPLLTPQHSHFIPAAYDSRHATPPVLKLQVIIYISTSLLDLSSQKARAAFYLTFFNAWQTELLSVCSCLSSHDLIVYEKSLELSLPHRAYCLG